jgi:poly(3-hydroxybutyrate) depolymerase
MDFHRRSSLPAALLVLACAGWSQTTVTLNFSVAGKSRNAVVYVPSGISNPPVVYFVHGYGGNGAGFANDTKGNTTAAREKFIAIYPTALGTTPSWSMQDTADYPFLRALLDTVDKRYKVDRNRVYCTGFSQGGFISNGVGYKHANLFAAVAPTSGHIPSFSTSAALGRPVPILTTFGTSDVSDVASFMKDINTWLTLNKCDLTSKKQERPYPARNKNSQVSRTSYTCAQGSMVVYDSVIGGGHEWAMDTVKKVNTTEEVWAFFKQFSLAGSTSVLAASGSGEPLVASYRAGEIRLEGLRDGAVVRVLDLKGGVVALAASRDQAIAFRNKPHGTYLVASVGETGNRTAKIAVP